MVPIALFCFALAGIGLLGLNVWYYRALVNARNDADAYCRWHNPGNKRPLLRLMQWSERVKSAWRHQLRRDGIFLILFLAWNDGAR